jgi:hypothetical protein
MQRASSFFAGVAQNLTVQAEHDWQMVGVDAEALNQCGGVGITFRIEDTMGLNAPAKEPLQAHDIVAVGPSDDDGAAGRQLQQV